MTSSQNAVREYVQEVKKQLNLSCPDCDREKFEHRIDRMVSAFLEDEHEAHPNAGYEELVREFGAPEKYVSDLLNECSEEARIRHQKKRRFTFAMIAAAMCIVIFVVGIFAVYNRQMRVVHKEVTTTIYVAAPIAVGTAADQE